MCGVGDPRVICERDRNERDRSERVDLREVSEREVRGDVLIITHIARDKLND